MGSFQTSLVLLGFITLFNFSGHVNALPEWTNEKRDLILDFLTESAKCRHIPGVSFALVYDGQVRMALGHGFDDIEASKPATENSRYCIGSLSKGFTSTLIGILLDESNGEYTWDTRVRDIMGEDFWLSEAVRNERATLRDLLAHKMGLATFGGLWIMGLPEGPSRQEYCERLRFLPPAIDTDFRQRFIYNNFMFLLTSCIAEKLGGKQYERLVEEKIFAKLGMDNSIFFENITEPYDVPAQYIWNYKIEKLERLHQSIMTETVPPAEASGGLCSPATDMAKWMLMQLGENVEEVINEATWRETHTPQMSSGGGLPHKKPQFPASWEGPNYGLGFEIGDYRGYRKVAHAGSTGSFSTFFALYPDVKLGIFTSVNGPMQPWGPLFMNTMQMYAMDVVMEEDTWLNVTTVGNVTSGTACTYPFPWADVPDLPVNADGLAKDDSSDKEARAASEEDFEPYLGVYGHLLLGDFNVYFNATAGEMWGTAGRIGIGRLVPTSEEDTFTVELSGPLEFMTELGPPLPPVVFSDPFEGVYQEVIAYVIDTTQPPVYVRDLAWDDLPPPPEHPCDTGSSWTLAPDGLVTLLTLLLFNLLALTQ